MKKVKPTHNKRRVALLGPFPPTVGGITSNLQHLIASPLKEKYQFYCFQTTSIKCGSAAYQNELICTKILRVLVDLVKFTILMVKHRPELIHINTSFGSWSFLRDSVYMIISRLLGKQILLQIHGGNLTEFSKHMGRINNIFINNAFRLPGMIGVLSSNQQQPFIEAKLADKVVIFPNMIDIDTFNHQTSMSGKKNDYSGKINQILFMAPHLFLQKGVYEFLAAAALILKQRNDAYFFIVGSGGEEAKMKESCKKQNLTNFIQFMGNISPAEVINIMHRSDIFTLPSYSEGCPMVILEAMAAGLPVIATNTGAIPEMITDGENGFILNPKDHLTLAEKILFLMDHPAQRRTMAEKNRAKVKQRHDNRIVAKLFDDSYQKLLGT